MTRRNPISLLIALLAALALVAAACGGDDGTDTESESDDTESSAEETDEEAEETTDTSAAEDEGDEEEDAAMDDGEAFRIAVVAPSAQNDLAFTQSMVDAVNALGENHIIDVEITDGTFVVEDAAAAIRGYAEDGFDLVIAHGSQYGSSLQEIAPDFPEVAFAWGTAADTFDLDNVSAYTVRADQGGYVLGTVAAQLSESGVIGVVGPIEVGDAKLYVDGFVNGVAAQDPAVEVNVNYIESFSDVALAAEAATTHITNGADALTGTAQMVVGATGVASKEGVPWFGTQSNQTALGEDIVVASQVYHWEILLEEMLASIEGGSLGGEVYTATLENGGLTIEFNDAYGLDTAIQEAAVATADGIADGSISTGVE
jgi:basic membrane protein A